MNGLIETWGALSLYTGLPVRKLRQRVSGGAFEVLPRDRKPGEQVSFRRAEVRGWYVEVYGCDPPGERSASCAG